MAGQVMNAIALATTLARKPLPSMEHQKSALRAYTALAEMCNGTARLEEYEDLCVSVNIVEALGTMERYDPVKVAPLVDAAIAGLVVAIKCPSGMMRMGAHATRSLREIVSMHDEAISKFGRGTIYLAMELVRKKIAEGENAEGLIVVNA